MDLWPPQLLVPRLGLVLDGAHVHLEFARVKRGKLLEWCLGEIAMLGVGVAAFTGVDNTDEDATVASVTYCGRKRQSSGTG